jgi:DNA polymerase III sliding clamp (beta) subunit (PCNA family)
MASRKLNLQNAKTWENLPDVWKVVKRVKPIDLYAGLKKDGIKDKGLLKLVQDFMSDDVLRPNLNGMLVEKDVIVCTDAHRLICIPAELGIDNGIYNISPKIAKKNQEPLYSKLSGNFPPYKDILPENGIIHKVDAYKLKTYSEAVLNGKYTNFVTHAISYKVEDDFEIGFNAEFLINVIDTFLLLGYTELYFGFSTPSRAIIISPNEATAKKPLSNIGKYPFALLMPLMLNDSFLGARELDFGTEIEVYFSFMDNEIHNADGSIANYDRNLSNTELPYIDSDSFSLINKMIPKNATLPILEYVKVKFGMATISNLDFFLTIKDVFVEDGMYEVCNGALKDYSGAGKIDDFPVSKREGDTLTLLAKIETEQLAQRTKEASMFVSTDDLRPVMMAMELQINADNRTKVFSTNAHIMLISSIYGSKVENNEGKYLIQNPKYLANVLDVVKDESVKVSAKNLKDNKTGMLVFESDNYVYSTKLIDAKNLDYEQVIDKNIDSYISFNTSEMILAINSIKGEDAKKSLFLDMSSKTDIKLKVVEYDIRLRESKIIKDLNISIPYTIGKSNKQYNNDLALIMPINTTFENGFTFDTKYLKTILMVADKDEARLNFDSRKPAPQIITELRPVEKVQIKREAKAEKKEPVVEKASKDDIMIKIEALQILADMGNKDAENNIEILKLLL